MNTQAFVLIPTYDIPCPALDLGGMRVCLANSRLMCFSCAFHERVTRQQLRQKAQ